MMIELRWIAENRGDERGDIAGKPVDGSYQGDYTLQYRTMIFGLFGRPLEFSEWRDVPVVKRGELC